MKTVVTRTRAGIAIPLPGRLAEKIGLPPGTELRIEGPDADGALRFVPVRTEPTAAAATEAVPPSGVDVVRALTRRRSPTESPPSPGAGITEEIERLVRQHGESFREVTP